MPQTYTVIIFPKAQKQIEKLPVTVQTNIIDVLSILESTPRPQGVKKLKGRDAWCIRSGNYRIIYEIHDNVLQVMIITVGHRKHVYKKK